MSARAWGWDLLGAGEVAVELYLGKLDARFEITDPVAIPMELEGEASGGSATFVASEVPCRDSGLHGYTVRVLPFHPDAPETFLPGLIRWADGSAGAATA